MREQGFADINGTRLHYSVAGAGEALVLLHGFSLDARMWDEQVARFAQRYRVVRYDLRGFGKSGLPQAPYSHVDDLKGLLEHLGIRRSHILGLSKGGGVALDFALSHPETTASLILVNTILGGFKWSAEASRQDGLAWQRAKEAGVEAGKAAWLAHPMFGPVPSNPAAASPFRQIMADYSGWHFVNANPERRAEPATIARLGELRTPTLIVIGERDLEDFQAIADSLERSIPGARKAVLKGAGHMANMEAPEEFNDLVLAFLASQDE